MTISNRFLILPTLLAVGVLFVMAGLVKAAIQDIQFPITELGNCESEDACFTYCEIPENQDTCFAFANSNGLVDEEDIEVYEEIDEVLDQGGPGGCRSHTECEAYCNDVNNIDECVDFAEQNGLMSSTELEEAKQVRKALKSGAAMPGNCSSRTECDAYCMEEEHMEECFAFAETAGFMKPEEREEAKKAMKMMRKGKTPGGCKSKDSCDAYCHDESHIDECVEFAVEAGHMTEEEAQLIKSKGSFGGPGGCNSRESCDEYCQTPGNEEECMEFAVASGHMSQEEAKMFKRSGFGGPGDCKGEAECKAFCSDPENEEECINFAASQGLISEDEAGILKEHCVQTESGIHCSSNQMLHEGPGGCTSKEECFEYCEDPANKEECDKMIQRTKEEIMMDDEDMMRRGMMEDDEMMRYKEGMMLDDEMMSDEDIMMMDDYEMMKRYEDEGMMDEEKMMRYKERMMLDEEESDDLEYEKRTIMDEEDHRYLDYEDKMHRPELSGLKNYSVSEGGDTLDIRDMPLLDGSEGDLTQEEMIERIEAKTEETGVEADIENSETWGEMDSEYRRPDLDPEDQESEKSFYQRYPEDENRSYRSYETYEESVNEQEQTIDYDDETKSEHMEWDGSNSTDRTHSDNTYQSDINVGNGYEDFSGHQDQGFMGSPNGSNFMEVAPDSRDNSIFVEPQKFYKLEAEKQNARPTIWQQVLKDVTRDVRALLEI